LALQRAGFEHWAYHYAERAVHLLPSGLWLCERLADTAFGWFGSFDEALLVNAAMGEARHDDLARLIDDPILADTDDLRAQVIYTYGLALVGASTSPATGSPRSCSRPGPRTRPWSPRTSPCSSSRRAPAR
jgi:hypothetical protein